MHAHPRFHPVAIAVVISVSVAGCGNDPEIRQYVIEAENERGLTSELLRRQFPTIPFRWDVPKSWQLASNDQFSVRAWSAGTQPDPARITLGQFPARTGIPAQVIRWQRQLGLESESPDEAMKNVKAMKTKNGAGSFATIEGAKETILAFILPIDDQFWIFRFKGTNTTAKAESDQFRNFCESLEYMQPPGTPATHGRSAHPSSEPSTSKPAAKPETDKPAPAVDEPTPSSADSTELTESKSDEPSAPADSSDEGE